MPTSILHLQNCLFLPKTQPSMSGNKPFAGSLVGCGCAVEGRGVQVKMGGWHGQFHDLLKTETPWVEEELVGLGNSYVSQDSYPSGAPPQP